MVPKKDSRRAVLAFPTGKWLWGLFSSMRTALVLMLILVGLSLIGALLIQMPQEVASNPQEYAWWLENVAVPKVGSWATILAFLGLFDVFHSFWFLGAGSLLMVNIAVCTLNRWQNFLRTTLRSSVKQTEAFYQSGRSHAELPYAAKSSKEMALSLTTALKKKHYRIRQETSSEGLYLTADKNRFSHLGSYINHLSIIVLIFGFLLGSYFGFRNTSFIVTEGEERQVGYGTGLSLRLTSFVDEYWADGTPRDYRSYVTLYEGVKEIKQEIIRVNYPMSYKGVRFYQSFFGPSVLIQVLSADGKALFNEGIPLSSITESMGARRPLGSLELSQTGTKVYFVASAYNAPDPMIEAGTLVLELYEKNETPTTQTKLQPGQHVNLGGLEFTFLQWRKYSGFQVSRDPGTPLVWLASGLFLIGTSLVFFFPRYQLWARASSDKGARLFLRFDATSGSGSDTEFQGIISELENLITATKSGEE